MRALLNQPTQGARRRTGFGSTESIVTPRCQPYSPSSIDNGITVPRSAHRPHIAFSGFVPLLSGTPGVSAQAHSTWWISTACCRGQAARASGTVPSLMLHWLTMVLQEDSPKHGAEPMSTARWRRRPRSPCPAYASQRRCWRLGSTARVAVAGTHAAAARPQGAATRPEPAASALSISTQADGRERNTGIEISNKLYLPELAVRQACLCSRWWVRSVSQAPTADCSRIILAARGLAFIQARSLGHNLPGWPW